MPTYRTVPSTTLPALIVGVPIMAPSSLVTGPAGAELSLVVPRIDAMPYDASPDIVVAASDAPGDLRSLVPDAQLCDGTADDVQIQMAIDALTNDGGHVALSAGDFAISATITIPNSVTISGQGWGTTLRLDDGADVDMFENADQSGGNSEIMIRDLKIDMNSGANSAGSGIDFAKSTWSRVERVFVKDPVTHGVAISSGSNGTTVVGVRVDGAGDKGVTVSNSDHVEVEGCIFTSCATGANFSFGSRNGSMVSCVAITCTTGFGTGEATECSFVSCIADTCGTGFTVTDVLAETVKHIGCTARACTGNGFKTIADNTHFIGCTSRNNSTSGTGTGIWLNGADHCTVVGCDLSDDQGTPTQEFGLFTDSGADSNLVVGNHCHGNATAQMQLAGSVDVVRDNDGFVTQNSGASKIDSGNTARTVAHGLDVTPAAGDFSIVFTEQADNDYGRWWVSGVGAANFTLNVTADPGASNLNFEFHVEV